MHIRIQTYGMWLSFRQVLALTGADGVNAQDVLEKGLDDLMALCDVVIEKFQDAHEEFEANKAS